MDNILLVIFIVCGVLRGIIFQNRDERWVKTLIPFYNKYILGKLSEAKKLGIAVAISNALFTISAYLKAVLELTISEAGETVSQDIIATNDAMLVVIYITAIPYFILWVTMMRRFSELQQTTTWWMILWGICPIVPYIYYSIIYKNYYIPKSGAVYREVLKKKMKGRKNE